MARDSYRGMPVRILIADDNAVFRKALRRLLEGADQWEIIEARDGREAVTKAAEIRPDVIVLDLAMPEKDGLAAAREISTLLPGIPMLMCSMHWSPHVLSEAKKSGIREVFSKTDSSLLIPAVRQLLGTQPADTEAKLADNIPPPAITEPPVAIPPPSAAPTETDPDPPPAPLPENLS